MPMLLKDCFMPSIHRQVFQQVPPKASGFFKGLFQMALDKRPRCTDTFSPLPEIPERNPVPILFPCHVQCGASVGRYIR